MNYGHRREFVNLVFLRQLENEDFSDKNLFSDELHFQLDGFVKWQIFSQEYPLLINEKQIPTQRVTAWCVFWPEKWKNEARQGQTVNDAR